MHIDHTTLRTAELEKTKDFLIRLFDLVAGPRPAVITENIVGYWLYHKNAPIIHLIESHPDPGIVTGYAVEAIDHTAFFMEHYDEFRKKLDKLNVSYSLMDLPDINERRIFIHTPTKILLEIVFRT